jgi:hypothetical protein
LLITISVFFMFSILLQASYTAAYDVADGTYTLCEANKTNMFDSFRNPKAFMDRMQSQYGTPGTSQTSRPAYDFHTYPRSLIFPIDELFPAAKPEVPAGLKGWNSDAETFFIKAQRLIPPNQRGLILNALYKTCDRIAVDRGENAVTPSIVATALYRFAVTCNMPKVVQCTFADCGQKCQCDTPTTCQQICQEPIDDQKVRNKLEYTTSKGIIVDSIDLKRQTP